MKTILIIRTDIARYEGVRDELTRQIEERGWDMPIFYHSYPDPEREEIEVVWIDEKMEMDKFIESVKHSMDLKE